MHAQRALLSSDGRPGRARGRPMDTGHGMDADVLARALEPFFTTRGLAVASGLGLSSVHAIVTAAGGKIELHSAPGEGTRVSVRLPAVSRATRARVMELPAPAVDSEVHAVLVVEDESIVRRLVPAALRPAGYRVREAARGGEALEALEGWQGRPDLLLTDVVMPDMDGPTLARRARALRPGLPVMFMCAVKDALDATPGAREQWR